MTPGEDHTLEIGLAILDTLDPNAELTQAELDIVAWRFKQLVDHGYEIEAAMEIARATYVDLELARTLTTELGCPSELAVRILL
jgi:hypothetical protein